MAEGDTGMNSARERLWRRLKIIAREQRLYVTGGCAGYNRADFHHSRRRTGRRDRADYTKVRFTYARGEPLANAGEWHHAARSEEGVRNGRSWPGSGRLSTFQR